MYIELFRNHFYCYTDCANYDMIRRHTAFHFHPICIFFYCILFPCFFLKFKISFAIGFNCSTFSGFFVFLSKSTGMPLPLAILILIIPTSFSSAFEKPLPFLMNFTPLILRLTIGLVICIFTTLLL